jgi:hypothetical protein
MATPTIATDGNLGVSGDFFAYYDAAGGKRRVFKGANTGAGPNVAGAIGRRNDKFLYVGAGGGNWRAVDGGATTGDGPNNAIGVRGKEFLYQSNAPFASWYKVIGDLDYIPNAPTLELQNRSTTPEGVEVSVGAVNVNPQYLSASVDLYRQDPNTVGFSKIASGIGTGYVDTSVTDGKEYEYYAVYKKVDSKGATLTEPSPEKQITFDSSGSGSGSPPGNLPEITSFDVTNADDDATCDYTATYDNTDGDETFVLDWGDGTVEMSSSPLTGGSNTYQFEADGGYTVVLEIQNDQGDVLDSATDTANPVIS